MPERCAAGASWPSRLGGALLAASLVSASVLHVPPAGAATVQVSVANLAFNPPSITVGMTAGEPGAEAAHGHVIWTVADPGEQHTVTFDDPRVVSSGPLADGQRHEAILYSPGTYAYRCTIHPAMTGTFVVTPAPPSTSAAGQPGGSGARPNALGNDTGSGSGTGVAPLLIGAVVLAALAGLAWLILRRRRPAAEAGPAD